MLPPAKTSASISFLSEETHGWAYCVVSRVQSLDDGKFHLCSRNNISAGMKTLEIGVTPRASARQDYWLVASLWNCGLSTFVDWATWNFLTDMGEAMNNTVVEQSYWHNRLLLQALREQIEIARLRERPEIARLFPGYCGPNRSRSII
jgi:hypothetical protein